MKDADLSSVTDAIFIVRKSLTYLDLSGAIMTSYTNIPGLCKDKTNKDYNLEYIDLTGTQFGNYDSAYQMFSRCKKIQTVEGFKLPINSSEMFNGCDKTTSITLLNCDASEVMNMNNMFKGCTALTTIDMSGFNAPNLTIMSSMFNGCTALTTVDLSGSNVPNVTNMSSLFKGCTALTTVNMSGFKAPNLKNCQSLFEGCSNLIVNTDIFTKWNATGITNLSYIFKDCTKMGTSSNGLIKLSDLNLSSCETMAGAFDGCTALTTLEFNNVNLESCSNYTGLISNCPALTNVNILSSNLTAAQDLSFLKPAKNINLSGSTFGMSSLANAFKSSNIERITLNSTQFPNCTNISSMFYGCINLTSVSMSGFNAPKLENCQSLFEGCSNLDVNADIFTKWNATGITNLSYIFKNCTKMGTSSN
jgi:surface protein